MKIKINLTVLLSIGLIFSLTGCSNKSLSDYELEKGSITSICTKNDSLDNIKIKIVTETNFDADGYLMNMKIYCTEKVKNKGEFEYRANETIANSEGYQNNSNMIYNYEIDEKNQIISYETIFTEFDFSDISVDEKSNYKASKYIKSSEKGGSKCKITGTTRKELELDK